ADVDDPLSVGRGLRVRRVFDLEEVGWGETGLLRGDRRGRSGQHPRQSRSPEEQAVGHRRLRWLEKAATELIAPAADPPPTGRSARLPPRDAELADRLVEHDPRRGGEVEAPHVPGRHRDLEAVVRVLLED